MIRFPPISQADADALVSLNLIIRQPKTGARMDSEHWTEAAAIEAAVIGADGPALSKLVRWSIGLGFALAIGGGLALVLWQS